MKHSILALIAVLFVALAVPVKSDAQVVRIERSIWANYQASNTSVDSVKGLQIKVVDPTIVRAPHLELTDAVPDSVRVSWFSVSQAGSTPNKDTLKVLVALQAHQVGGAYDSIYVTTIWIKGALAIQTSGYTTISGGAVASYDEFGVKLVGQTDAVIVTTHRPKLFVRVEYFFHE